MLDVHTTAQHAPNPARSAGDGAHPVGPAAYRGPERRGAASTEQRWVANMLDEIDYGVLLVEPGGQVLHANHAALRDLARECALRLDGKLLLARSAGDSHELAQALEAAAWHGLRRLLELGAPGQRMCVSIVPISHKVAGEPAPAGRQPGADRCGPRFAAVVFGRRQVCEPLSVMAYARVRHLTRTETRILLSLCTGSSPREVAESQRVALSTVRTQIGSIRTKTGSAGIRELLSELAQLPPLVNALRLVTA